MNRPTDFVDVIGQDTAISILKNKLSTDQLPNTILLHGPSGVGKTTIARILATKLGVHPNDIEERNCASVRSIDSVRELDETIHHYGLFNKRRVIILDEIVQLSKTTQQAALKIIEEPPSHVYFIACTTSLENLLDTFVSRFFRIDLNSLSDKHLKQIISIELSKQTSLLEIETVDSIISISHRSARVALSLLEKILACPVEARESLLQESSSKESKLVNLLLKRAKWVEVVQAINQSGSDYESTRWGILAYTVVVMSKRQDPVTLSLCSLILKSFKYSFRDCGKAGLYDACWNICQSK